MLNTATRTHARYSAYIGDVTRTGDAFENSSSVPIDVFSPVPTKRATVPPSGKLTESEKQLPSMKLRNRFHQFGSGTGQKKNFNSVTTDIDD